MRLSVIPLTPVFAARVDGVDIARPVDDGEWAEIRAAFEEYSVLLFRGQSLTDESQVGLQPPLRLARGHPEHESRGRHPFARQSNLDINTGEVIPPDDRRMIYQLAKLH